MSTLHGGFTPGSSFRQYRLTEKLLEDQLGTLWRAEDSALARLVMIRILPAEFLWDSRSDLLITETNAATHLSHPNLAKVVGLDQWNENFFIVSENMDGKPLPLYLREETLRRASFLELALQLAGALAEAHGAGIIHGNLHGSLIFTTGRSASIGGFGTGRTAALTELVESELERFSPVYYLSPERVLGKSQDARSDVFSLGVILYEMGTGRLPFTGQTTAEVCDRVLSKAPPRPQLYVATIDPAIVGVIGRCLQKDPTKRYPNARGVLEALAALGRSVMPEVSQVVSELPSESSASLPRSPSPPSALRDLLTSHERAEERPVHASIETPSGSEGKLESKPDLESSSDLGGHAAETAETSALGPSGSPQNGGDFVRPVVSFSIDDDEVPPSSLFFGGDGAGVVHPRSTLSLDRTNEEGDEASDEQSLPPLFDVQLNLGEEESPRNDAGEGAFRSSSSVLRNAEHGDLSSTDPQSLRDFVGDSSTTPGEPGPATAPGTEGYEGSDPSSRFDSASPGSVEDFDEFAADFRGGTIPIDDLMSEDQEPSSERGLADRDLPVRPAPLPIPSESFPTTRDVPDAIDDEDYPLVTSRDERTSIILYACVTPAARVGENQQDKVTRVMQQILGETAYLFDGKVVDPFGPRMVAEFTDARQALLAARKGRDDLEEYNRAHPGRGSKIDARMVIVFGMVHSDMGNVAGPAVDLAASAAENAPPLQPIVAADVLRMAAVYPATPPLQRTGSTDFYELPSEESLREKIAETEAGSPDEGSDEKKVPLWTMVAVAALVLVLAAATGGYLALRANRKKAARLEQARTAAANAVRPRPAAAIVTEVAVDPFSVEVSDAALTIPPEPATTARLVAMGILGKTDGIALAQANVAALRFGGRIRQGASGPELIPVRSGSGTILEGPVIPLNDSVAVSNAYLSWISKNLNRPLDSRLSQSPAALKGYADAIEQQLQSSGAPVSSRALTAIRASIKADPAFLSAQLLAMEMFSRISDRKSAMDSAIAALNIDPRNVTVRSRLAAWKLQSGATVDGLEQYKRILTERPSDLDALHAIGLHALAVGDERLFRAVLDRLTSAPRGSVLLHEPDLELARGSIDTGTTQLFDLEASDNENPALALKIGRFSVLRRQMGMADIEMQKLQRLSSDYGYNLLTAYVLAEKGKRAEAVVALKRAQDSASWNEQPFTASAEVHAVLGNSVGVMDSLEHAISRGEPTGAYILNNPLFRYLRTDARFRRIQSGIRTRQTEIRKALANVGI